MPFFTEAETRVDKRAGVEVFHAAECKMCPLNSLKGNKTPHMKALGSVDPLIYILGPAPDEEDDKAGKPFVGQQWRLLRRHLPHMWRKEIRWNNVVRTKPSAVGKPDFVSIECCRPSIIRDVERTKPVAIFGFGETVLHWVTNKNSIEIWRGRKLPVRIGNHVCWFFPLLHPYELYKLSGKKADKYQHEAESVFARDLKNALKFVDDNQQADKPKFARVHTPKDAEADIELIDGSGGLADLRRLREIFEDLDDEVGFDYETHNLRPYNKDSMLLTFAISDDKGTTTVALDHPESKWSELHIKHVKRLLLRLLKDPTRRKIVHNSAFELEWSAVKLSKSVLDCKPSDFVCTLTQAAAIDERTGRKVRGGGPLSLDSLVLQYFGLHLKALSKLDRARLKFEPLREVLRYNGMDAKYHRLLYRAQLRVIKEQGLMEGFRRKNARITALVAMQRKGVPIDLMENAKLDVKYTGQIKLLYNMIMNSKEVALFKKKVKPDFSPTSNQDLLKLFKDVLHQQRHMVRTKRGKTRFAVDEETLKAVDTPFSLALLEFRKVTHLKSTYVEPYNALSPLLYPGDLLHPVFNSVFTETGRLSSDNPNMQNTPSRNEAAKEIRKQFVAPKGYVFIAIDYKQIEALVIAMASRDREFVKMLWERLDIHGKWARKIAETYPARVGGVEGLRDPKIMAAFRTDVKNQWTFPLVFGAQNSSVSGYLDIPEPVIEKLVHIFWRELSGVKRWQDGRRDEYNRRGYVETLTGWRRRAPLTPNQILNSPIQGTAVDIVVDAMVRLKRYNDDELVPFLQIHDELIFMLRDDTMETKLKIILDEMLAASYKFVNVPISVSVSVGYNLFDMEKSLEASSDDWEFDIPVRTVRRAA